MAEHVAPRLRTVFRDLARGITVHEIDQMWQDEGFAPGEGSTYNGVRMSRWSDYEASVDWTSWMHVTRVLRVYEQALPVGEAATEERARIALQLDRNGYRLTNDGRIEPASPYGDGARGPQMSRRITEITRHRIREIHDRGCPDFWWSGKLEEHEFLSRIYPLHDMPSTDDRVRDAEADIRQHRLANYDWPDDWVFTDPRFGLEDGHDHKFLRFLAEMLHPVVRPDAETVQTMLTALNEALAPDGYELFEHTSISGRPIYSSRDRNGFHQNAAALKSNRPMLNDPRVLHEHLDRINRSIDNDPSAAISSCKDLVESLCKIILEQEHVEYDRGEDLPALYKKVALTLRLNAEAVPDSAKGSASAQRVLRTLTTTVQNLSELRNELGTGHGRPKASSLRPRHARLALNSTVTVTEFLLDTWHERAKLS